MSQYITRRDRVVSTLVADYGINELVAHGLVRDWEYEANRRGIDPNSNVFWTHGRDWMGGQVILRGLVAPAG